MKLLCSITLLMVLCLNAYGQSSYVPLNNSYYHTVDRYEILNGKMADSYFSSVKPYTRKAVAAFIDTLAKDSASLKHFSKADRFNFTYLANDNWEFSSTADNDSRRPLLKTFYKKKSDAFSVHTQDFDLHVNPVVYVSGGYERNYGALSQNTRGIELRGMIDQKVGFYTFFTDNQALMPSYVTDYRTAFHALPGEGYVKNFKTRGVDFISARGYINFNVTKHIALQFGHDKNFLGNGYRSLILSDNSSGYTFLKLNTKIWKFNYMNLFTEMTAYPKSYDTLFAKKYVNYHHLSINLFKKLNIGIFEAVALRGRTKDSTKPGQFDITYLNPVIFYRSAEQQLGSFDNAMMGFDFKYNFLRHFSLYGQIILDEFVLDQVRSGKGWWANKQALQGGLKYIDAFGVKNLDLQGEINYVRPYTYAHYNNFTNFSNYNQPLAHPLGANFTELIGIARYQPISRLTITAKAFLTKLGTDTAGVNWGGNIFKNYTTYQQEYGNRTGQGIATNLIYTTLNLTYMAFHNIFIDGYVTYRNYNSTYNPLDRVALLGGMSIRWYIPQRLQEF
ncbi:MAG TPA: hypothetical protein VNB90_05745 [Cytophagaceae bacterium]|nr:hypothetical protein [Cytophagaceae bacterium]